MTIEAMIIAPIKILGYLLLLEDCLGMFLEPAVVGTAAAVLAAVQARVEELGEELGLSLHDVLAAAPAMIAELVVVEPVVVAVLAQTPSSMPAMKGTL